jgi:NodT family efflux transporter outer membrane factor (OMF) lipoprotein
MRTTLPALACILLAGCSLAPEPEEVTPAEVERLPGAYAEADESARPYEPARWWRGFRDPGLDRMVDTVLAANLDLQEAVARVLEARALARVATADLLPSLNGAVEVSRSSNPNNAGFGRQIADIIGGAVGDTAGGEPIPAPPDRFENTNYSASLGLAYEVDFWGRARSDRAAALRDLEASEADLQAVVLGVLAETVTAWFQAAELRRRVVLTEEIVGVLEDRVALTETRYDRGLVTSFELYQVRQELRNAEASLPELRNQRDEAEGRLAVLAGRYPAELAPLLDPLALPEGSLPPVPAALPSDLLWQRPDVRAAGRRLEAARMRVGARRAELLPGLNLTGTLGVHSSDADEWLDLSQWFSNLAAGLTAPLFQGGRLRANVAAAQARLQQQTAAYGRAVLTAFVEVENALAQLREEESRFSFFRAQLVEAEASVDLQSRRYASGVGGYADYLDALRNRLTVANGVASAARDYALARLAVHRALGGDWVEAADSESTDAPEGS